MTRQAWLGCAALGGTAQPVAGAPNRPSRRALIGIDKDRRLFIAVTDKLLGGLTCAELQELFTAPQWQLPHLRKPLRAPSPYRS